MKLVDADALKRIFDKRYDTAFEQEHTRENAEWWRGYATGINWGRNSITDVSSVEVVKCENCKHYVWDEFDGCYCCISLGRFVKPDFWCADGKNKKEGA